MAASEDSEHLQQLFRAIKAVIRKIPRGRVATYGQIAELAGIPGGARIAAAALKTSQPADQLPWQRVIGKAGTLRGRIAIHDPVGAAIQRELLTAERIEVGDTGLIALDRFGWLPSPGSAPRGGRGRGASLRRRPRSGSKSRASSSRR
ncbi:MAG: Methylated-DNA-(protein)-cysteine S-methyltransferase binding protein [Deltaproteobacteria bacterium]|nr:Methylated-DNA-(protein)-cysteine S-methyltransferase binding protein [Deltaproteobacteria bacterium]